MFKFFIAFLIAYGFIATEAEYYELPQDVQIEYQEIYQNIINEDLISI